jgi:hypothetical protein
MNAELKVNQTMTWEFLRRRNVVLKVIHRPEPTLSASYNLGDRVCFIVGNTRPSALEDTMTEQTNPPLRGLIPHLTVRGAQCGGGVAGECLEHIRRYPKMLFNEPNPKE